MIATSQDGFIQVENLTKRYGQRTILDDVSVSINGGETIALIGPSGGGKSTLLRCINGLNSLDAGSVRVGEHTIRAAQPAASQRSAVRDVRRLMGMIFQDFQLFAHLSAIQNVMEAPLRVLGLSRAEAESRAMKLLERVGLAGHANHYPLELSGGQKQRVAIARALAMEPRGLLCDEITSALDPELKHEVLEVLTDLKKEGLTLLMVTHEIGFARHAADRVLVLADGKIIEDGPPQQVLEAPKNPRTQQFLRNVLG